MSGAGTTIWTSARSLAWRAARTGTGTTACAGTRTSPPVHTGLGHRRARIGIGIVDVLSFRSGLVEIQLVGIRCVEQIGQTGFCRLTMFAIRIVGKVGVIIFFAYAAVEGTVVVCLLVRSRCLCLFAGWLRLIVGFLEIDDV